MTDMRKKRVVMFTGFILFKKKKIRLKPGVRMLLVGFLLLFLTPFPSEGDSLLPQSVGSLTLQKLQSGEEAKQAINRMHGKELSFKRGYIGIYGGEHGKGTLWVSEYDSEEGAVEDLKKMVQMIRTGDQKTFGHFREMSIEGLPVYLVLGMGQAHYFFQKGMKVIWLAVDPSLAKETIRDLIEKIS